MKAKTIVCELSDSGGCEAEYLGNTLWICPLIDPPCEKLIPPHSSTPTANLEEK